MIYRTFMDKGPEFSVLMGSVAAVQEMHSWPPTVARIFKRVQRQPIDKWSCILVFLSAFYIDEETMVKWASETLPDARPKHVVWIDGMRRWVRDCVRPVMCALLRCDPNGNPIETGGDMLNMRRSFITALAMREPLREERMLAIDAAAATPKERQISLRNHAALDAGVVRQAIMLLMFNYIKINGLVGMKRPGVHDGMSFEEFVAKI